MEIMVDKPWYTEGEEKNAKNATVKYSEKNIAVGALTGVLIAKNN